jgi:hypothetical protein
MSRYPCGALLVMGAAACDAAPAAAPRAEVYDARCANGVGCQLVVESGYCGYTCPAYACLSTAGATAFTADQDDYWRGRDCPDEGAVECTVTEFPDCGCIDDRCVVL